MAKLIYSVMTSLDGYVADADGRFDWAVPDAEVHAFVNDLERPIGTYLYGRRMYEVMVGWETAYTRENQPPFVPGSEIPERDFAEIWRAADKVVYSKTLETVSSTRTRVESEFVHEEIRQMKGQADRDITVGGPDLASQAIAAGLVDELRVFVTPVLVGDGKRALPRNIRTTLELLSARRFHSGVVFLHYVIRKGAKANEPP